MARAFVPQMDSHAVHLDENRRTQSPARLELFELALGGPAGRYVDDRKKRNSKHHSNNDHHQILRPAPRLCIKRATQAPDALRSARVFAAIEHEKAAAPMGQSFAACCAGVRLQSHMKRKSQAVFTRDAVLLQIVQLSRAARSPHAAL
jgi:hypothetical protein